MLESSVCAEICPATALAVPGSAVAAAGAVAVVDAVLFWNVSSCWNGWLMVSVDEVVELELVVVEPEACAARLAWDWSDASWAA